jgi:ribonuclease HI
MSISQIEIWTDGGARGNPGPAAIGIVIKKDGQTIYEASRCIGRATNNQAEYQAVILSLEYLRSQSITTGNSSITSYVDSELVSHQLNGLYKVKHVNMKSLYLRIQELLKIIGRIKFIAIRRSQNSRADQLVNEALDKQVVSR